MSKKKTTVMIVLLFIAELFVMITRNSLINTLPDNNFTGDKSDFDNHKYQMIMSRVAKILEDMK